ncbi:hypothetical protein Tco_0516620 [Tanacetum coccineum]
MSRYYTLDEDTYPRHGLVCFYPRRVVPLLPVSPAHAKSGLEASVDKLFDEGVSTKQGDSAAGGGHDAEIELVTDVEDTATRNVTVERPKLPRKKRPAVTDASGSSHPPKKLRGDHGTSSGAATGGKSLSVLKELLASSLLNVEAGVEATATLPFITSSISASLGLEGGDPTDSITELNLRTIGLVERFVISSDSSHHSSTNASEAEVDSIIMSVVPPPVMTEVVVTSHVFSASSILVPETETKTASLVRPYIFYNSSSAGTIKLDVAGSSHLPEKELLMGSREINSENIHEVFLSHWNVPNDTLLDDHDISQELIDHLAPPVLFSQIREMDYHHLFTEFNVGTDRQACLNAKARDEEIENLKTQLLLKEVEVAEVACLRVQVSAIEAAEKVRADELNALKQRNVALEDERNSLNGKIMELQSSVSAKDLELKDFNVTMSSLKSHNDGLVDQVHALEATCFGLRDQVSGYERLKEQIVESQDAQMNILNDKVAKLDADILEMALHLEEKFYPHLLTTISGLRWLLTHGLKLTIVKCLNSPEYLATLGAAMSRAIEKGMQSGMSAGIDHGKAGRSLADVAAYNPAAEADFNFALQRLRKVDFPLLFELSSYKDASVTDIMDLLRLESPLADAPRMSDLQPDVEQLMLPIHRPEDEVVLGETSLSFALSVSHSWVERIRENISAQRSALVDVWVPLVDRLSAKNLMGAADTSNSVPATVTTTTALSTTFASASSVPPITIEDYKIAGTDGQEDAQGNVQGNVASFSTVEFEEEELDTTP